MIHPINNLINDTFKYNIDMLHNLSLSANASQIKYSMMYDEFNNNYHIPGFLESIPIKKSNSSKFIPTLEWFKKKCEGYKQQDIDHKRDVSNNISEKDFEYSKDLISNSTCHWCNIQLSNSERPTLEKLDNSLGHSKSNCVLSYLTCNRYCSDNDKMISKLRIILKK